jgi:hypothetical protein
MKSRQRGLSMIGFLFVAVVLVMLAMLVMKVVPAYVEFFSVKKILATMGQQSDFRNMSNAEIRNDFEKRASVGLRRGVTGRTMVDRRGGVPVDRRIHVPHQACPQRQPGHRFQRQQRSKLHPIEGLILC